jgi:ABC-type multidrug transport system fused ATPase/permease subunit
LKIFPHGDLTIIGKKGSTLSGGQRARVSFARALYSNADIFILDDLLSAVDAHVGAFLFSISIKQFLKNKTVLLITHSLYHVSHTDRIVIF